MQPHPPTYKPSPLSYGSPRTSPFKRPDSPASPFRRPDSPSSPSPIPSNRATTPTPTSPTKLQAAITATPPSEPGSRTPRGGLNVTPSPLLTTSREEPKLFSSPSRSETSSTATMTASHQFQPSNNTNNTATPERPPIMGGLGGRNNPPTRDALSQMPPSRVREMRECFQILDRDNDGLVTREDVADMLTNLGDPTPPSTTTATTTPFFPPSTPYPLPLPTYLSTLSTLLHPLSSPAELLNAFSAFDERDSGEIDLRELKDALTHTQGGMSARAVEEVVGGFVGRREFGKEGGRVGARGEVFRYREWVAGLMGGEERKGEGEGER
ncbi:hypothetical protein BDR22DRAFT_561176 [Usnea florida]